MNFINEFNKVIRETSTILEKPIDPSRYEIIDRGVPHPDNGCLYLLV